LLKSHALGDERKNRFRDYWRHAVPNHSEAILSLKEQYRLDVNLHRGAKRMLSALKFLPAVDETASLQAIESYRLFHRYYPTFRHVED
jgi:hypothetical protein